MKLQKMKHKMGPFRGCLPRPCCFGGEKHQPQKLIGDVEGGGGAASASGSGSGGNNSVKRPKFADELLVLNSAEAWTPVALEGRERNASHLEHEEREESEGAHRGATHLARRGGTREAIDFDRRGERG